MPCTAHRAARTLPLLLLAVLLLVGRAPGQTLRDPALEAVVFATGLTQPTALAILSAGTGAPVDMLVAEKNNGHVLWLRDGVVQGIALDLAVNFASERGLLGLALDPDFATNARVYVYYTASATAGDSNGFTATNGHRVERYVWNGSTLSAGTPLLALPSSPGPNHDGGVLRFGPDGHLYGVLGDLNRRGQLQNEPLGPPPDDTSIVFRIDTDGVPPGDNPFSGTNTMKRVYAYGIRNSFGMDFDPQTGSLWLSENGPSVYDEINRVPPGFNSGWTAIMGPDARDPEDPTDLWMAPGAVYLDPAVSWLSPVGVTALHFVTTAALGSTILGNCLVGDTNTGDLYRFTLTPDRTAFVLPGAGLQDRVIDSESERDALVWGEGFGVVTAIASHPSGVFVLSLSQGVLYRLQRRDTAGVGPPAALRLEVHPNPGSPPFEFRLRGPALAAGDLRVAIYDAAGRRVRRLRDGGDGLSWNGYDGQGRRVAAGVYFVRATAGATRTPLVKLIHLHGARRETDASVRGTARP